ncbi:hypothetical protein O9X98_15125 [Agrobacterium salinitolerans]|nr:hypothetical protein [Agrobacterium salinitolerans]
MHISVLRKSKSDEEILEHLKRTHETMRGTDLLSGIDGSATDVLDALPEAAREKFVALASVAFPQRRNEPTTPAIAP